MRPTSTGVAHAVAECRDCPWSTTAYKNAVANAARHHDATGHTVMWEQLIVGTYGEPREALAAGERERA